MLHTFQIDGRRQFYFHLLLPHLLFFEKQSNKVYIKFQTESYNKMIKQIVSQKFIRFASAFLCAMSFSLLEGHEEKSNQELKLEFIHVKQMQTNDNKGIAGLKRSFLELLQKLFQIDTFIESGTYLGDTTENASQVFSQVHTIELASGLYEKAKARFANHRNVNVYFGDSAKELPHILTAPQGKILFFLDGHFSKRDTAKGDKNTPISGEIEAIIQSGIKDSIIIVDDVRFFQNSMYEDPDPAVADYPSLLELFKQCQKINPDYQIAVIGDLALIYPVQEKVNLSPIVEACTASRLLYELHLPYSETKALEKIIGAAVDEELDCIEFLYHHYGQGEIRYGLRSFSSLWYALTLLQKGEDEAAKVVLKQAVDNSLHDWQALEYLQETNSL